MAKKTKGWLDNYNDYSVSAPEGYEGDGFDMTGRNYSPAWGGQFEMGGSLAGAAGMMYARHGAPSNGPYAKKTMPSAQDGVKMNDPVAQEIKSYVESPLYLERLKGMGVKDAQSLQKDRSYFLENVKYGTDPTASHTTTDVYDMPIVNLKPGSTEYTKAHELGHVISSFGNTREVPSMVDAYGNQMSPKESWYFMNRNVNTAKTANQLNPTYTVNKNEKDKTLRQLAWDMQHQDPENTKLYSEFSPFPLAKPMEGENIASQYYGKLDPHDINPGENYGDLTALRHALLKQGYTKSFGENLSQEVLDKAFKDQKINSIKQVQRMRKNFKDSSILDINNKIAYQDNNRGGDVIAKDGTSVYYQHGLDFTPKSMQNGGTENWASREMKQMYNTKMRFDDKSVLDVVREAAKLEGIDPSLLMSSAWQEGMNTFLTENKKNWTVGEHYNLPDEKSAQFPVDGFQYYGLDTFSDRYDKLKKYLPKNFEFAPFKAVNEKGEKINTAAFKNNRDALVAKAAMLKNEIDSVKEYAQKKNLNLDQKALDYFTLSSYNGGFGNAKIMMDQYEQAKDKNAFIDNGETTRKGVHKNVLPRILNMKVVNDLISTEDSNKKLLENQLDSNKFIKAPNSTNPLPLFKDGGQTSDDREMLEGVADMLRRVKDPKNRKDIANYMMGNFRDEDVTFEPKDFLEDANVFRNGGHSVSILPTAYVTAKIPKRKYQELPQATVIGKTKFKPPQAARDNTAAPFFLPNGSQANASNLGLSKKKLNKNLPGYTDVNLDALDALTDYAQFIPGPIGIAAEVAGLGIDAYQAYDAFKNKRPIEGTVNTASALLPFIPKSTYKTLGNILETGYDTYSALENSKNYKNGGEMIRRADGSYSRRGLWDNIRANKGSGKKPTKEMLKQERKIKASMQNGGWFDEEYSRYLDPVKGGFLQPNSPKLPFGYYAAPNVDSSSELASSIGGENGEPAYLIPTFKYGKRLNNPIAEYIRTGEHLGGPFKTWQEADEWDQNVRHPYVEQGLPIPSPLRTWGSDFPIKKQMGGPIPVDPLGYWNPDNVGNPVIIPSTDITMRGVDQDLIGVSNTGDVKKMKKGKNYKFDGDYVTEYPINKQSLKEDIPKAQQGIVRVKDSSGKIVNYDINSDEYKKLYESGKLASYDEKKDAYVFPDLPEFKVTAFKPYDYEGCVSGLCHNYASRNNISLEDFRKLNNVYGDAWNVMNNAYGEDIQIDPKNYSNLKVNDLVSLSRKQFKTDKERGIPESNQHVGSVSKIVDGVPYVKHYVGNRYYEEPINNINQFTEYTPSRIKRLPQFKDLTYGESNFNFDKDYTPNAIENEVFSGIKDKKNIQNVLRLDSDEYDNLAKLAYGIIGAESSFGKSKRSVYRMAVPDFLQKLVKVTDDAIKNKDVYDENVNNLSQGYASIKESSLHNVSDNTGKLNAKQVKDKIKSGDYENLERNNNYLYQALQKFGLNTDNLENGENSFKALMSALSWYKKRNPNATDDDLLKMYTGKKDILKYKNNVNKYRKNIDNVLGNSEESSTFDDLMGGISFGANKINSALKNSFGSAVGVARDISPLSVNKNQFIADLLGSKSSITKQSLSDSEYEALINIVKSNISKNKFNLEYGDYNTSASKEDDVGGKSTSFEKLLASDPNYALKTLLGQANIKKVGKDKYVVEDTFDYNDQGKSFGVVDDLKKRGISAYALVRSLGRNYGSSNNQGSKVQIPIDLSKKQNGGEITKLDQLTNFTNYNTKQPGGWLDKYK